MRQIKVSLSRKQKPNGGYPPEFNDFFKAQVRARDRHLCAVCECDEDFNGQRLDVHHIDYNKRNTTRINCISLCRNCHDMIHHSSWSDRQRWKYKLWRIVAEREYEQRAKESPGRG